MRLDIVFGGFDRDWLEYQRELDTLLDQVRA